MVQPDRAQMTIWRMRIAFWIPKATYTHSEYVILIAFVQNQWLHEVPQCYVMRTLLSCSLLCLVVLFYAESK
jgi:hypothetical protein